MHGAGASVADVRHVDLRKSLQPETDDTEDWTKPAVREADDAAVFRKFVDNIVHKVPAEAANSGSKSGYPCWSQGRAHPNRTHSWRPGGSRNGRPIFVALLAGSHHRAPGLRRGRRSSRRARTFAERPPAETGHHLHDIAAQMRDGKTDRSICAGVTGFLDADWQQPQQRWFKRLPPKPDAEQSSAGK